MKRINLAKFAKRAKIQNAGHLAEIAKGAKNKL
jgi:hypothetical protein